MLFLSIIVLCTTACLISVVPKLKTLLKLIKVPGPIFPRGLKGNIPEYMATPRQTGPKMTAKYGPLYRTFTVNLNMQVNVSDPAIAKELHQSQGLRDHPVDGGFGHFLARFFGDSMGGANGKVWDQHRKVFRSAMTSAVADASLENIVASLDEWEEQTIKPLVNSGQKMKIHELVGLMPITVMLNIFFGRTFVSNHYQEIIELKHHGELLLDTILYDKAAAFFWYKYLDTEPNRVLKDFQERWANLLRRYEKSNERLDGHGGSFDTVLEHLENHSNTLTHNQMANTMVEIIFSNQDVLHPALTWLVADLMVYPQTIKSMGLKANQEIDRKSLEEEFPVVYNVIRESSRVHPFFAYSIPNVTKTEMVLGGYTIPEGTAISVDQYSLNHNPKYWSDPTEFKPERFENLQDLEKKWGAFRFGFGSRKCPGQYYANLILANVVSRLFSNYKVTADMDNVSHHHDIPLLKPGRLTMLPDFQVTLTTR